MVGNGGFEAPVVGPTTNAPVPPSVGNWLLNYQAPRGTTLERVTSPVRYGDWALRLAAPAGQGAPYAMQDLLLVTGDVFEFQFDVWPILGAQLAAVTFDWDRGVTGEAAGSVTANMTADAFSVTLSGSALQDPGGNPLPEILLDPLPYGEWTNVLLRIRTALTGWNVGKVGLA